MLFHRAVGYMAFNRVEIGYKQQFLRDCVFLLTGFLRVFGAMLGGLLYIYMYILYTIYSGGFCQKRNRACMCAKFLSGKFLF